MVLNHNSLSIFFKCQYKHKSPNIVLDIFWSKSAEPKYFCLYPVPVFAVLSVTAEDPILIVRRMHIIGWPYLDSPKKRILDPILKYLYQQLNNNVLKRLAQADVYNSDFTISGDKY